MFFHNICFLCYQSVIIRFWYKVRPKARRLNRTLEVIWFSFVTVSWGERVRGGKISSTRTSTLQFSSDSNSGNGWIDVKVPQEACSWPKWLEMALHFYFWCFFCFFTPESLIGKLLYRGSDFSLMVFVFVTQLLSSGREERKCVSMCAREFFISGELLFRSKRGHCIGAVSQRMNRLLIHNQNVWNLFN